MSSRSVKLTPEAELVIETSPDGLGESFQVVSGPLVGVGVTVLFKIGDEKVVGDVKVAILRPLLVVEVLDDSKVNGTLFLTPEDTRYEWPADHLFFRLSKDSCVQSVVGVAMGDALGQWRIR